MKRAALGFLTVLAVVLGLSWPAQAGGWAVTTLDPLPAAQPGEPMSVGFTIRQHGVTPVDLTDVAIVVYSADGAPLTFPARSDGTLGHYVADVTVPAGTHRWEVVQGSFGPQDLGPLVVGGSTTAAAPPAGSEPRWPQPVRFGLLALTAASAAVFVVALVGLVGGRQRRPASA